MNKSNDDFTENHANQFMIPLAPHAPPSRHLVFISFGQSIAPPLKTNSTIHIQYNHTTIHIYNIVYLHINQCVCMYT
jgi:hypothetical protein